MAKTSMECKKQMVKEISDRLNSANMLIVTNYNGLGAVDLNELRKELRASSGQYLVVKDSLIKKAIEGSPCKAVSDLVEGAVGIVVDKEKDPTVLSKVLIKFSKDHESLKIRGGYMDGALISSEDVNMLAALPSREVLLGKLANVLNAPIQNLAGALNGIITKLVYALNAVKDKKTE
jgi:large subunit ribosomal protein L10